MKVPSIPCPNCRNGRVPPRLTAAAACSFCYDTGYAPAMAQFDFGVTRKHEQPHLINVKLSTRGIEWSVICPQAHLDYRTRHCTGGYDQGCIIEAAAEDLLGLDELLEDDVVLQNPELPLLMTAEADPWYSYESLLDNTRLRPWVPLS